MTTRIKKKIARIQKPALCDVYEYILRAHNENDGLYFLTCDIVAYYKIKNENFLDDKNKK